MDFILSPSPTAQAARPWTSWTTGKRAGDPRGLEETQVHKGDEERRRSPGEEAPGGLHSPRASGSFCRGQSKFHWDLPQPDGETHNGGPWAKHPWSHFIDEKTESQRG